MSCVWSQFQDEMLHEKTFTKKHLIFFVPCSRFQDFKHISQNEKPQKMTNERRSPISPKKS